MMEKLNEILSLHRRNLHKIPETAYNEFKTSEYIKNVMGKMDSFKLIPSAKTGFLAEYRACNGSFIAFRTDIDALKIKEETGLDFSSEHEGYMHACGHDLHMSMLLTFAQYIHETRPDKNVLLIFQPAEEGFGGGELMVKEGLFEKFDIREIYALHNTTEFPVGVIALNGGKMFAGTIEFEINLEGKGGHAAVPHENNDLVTATAHLVNMLNTIVPRFLDPVNENVLSIGMIHAGEAANILPSFSVIKGTARSYYKNDLNTIKLKMKDIVNALTIAFGIKAKLMIHTEYTPAINNPDVFRKIKETDFGKGISIVECPQKMTGEDFGFMLEKAPGAIAWLGAGNDVNKGAGLHNQAYNPDERAMVTGFAYYKKLLEQFNN